MKRMLVIPALAMMFLGCGGSDDPAAPDATAATPDSAGSSVTMVDCVANPPDADIITSNFAYSPMATTITAGQVVRFDIEASHDVASTTSGQAFAVGFGGMACFRFAQAGTFTFECTPHQFTGSITVN